MDKINFSLPPIVVPMLAGMPSMCLIFYFIELEGFFQSHISLGKANIRKGDTGRSVRISIGMQIYFFLYEKSPSHNTTITFLFQAPSPSPSPAPTPCNFDLHYDECVERSKQKLRE